jgi:hypothetical protein
MDLSTLALAVALSIALLIALWVPYYIIYIRRGKAHGHTWFTWWKPRGHSDIGPDIGDRPTRPGGVDEARGARW